ncbi:response regulator [Ensifer sp. T173]|uniref:Response regulator n=1 Tax=Ensifer canadensis TaxID=555315 RepID=A0AAW4FVV1_9HYPH|nr:response regulator [Ensifer canadensis]MBM3095547.1 response regulator [Ensifer canadensis]UBI79857.1 response regulator [Ensifer canadensis]
MTTELTGYRILVAEDDYLQADEISRIIRRTGAIVVGPFPSVNSCLEQIATSQISGAVVDINMGKGPCFEIARWLKERAVPFFFLTGYDHQIIPSEFSTMLRLQKPVAEDELVSTLHLMLQISA